MYWRRSVTRVEAAIYAGLIAVLLAIFLERLLYYMEVGERTAMEVTVSRVNSAINVHLAHEMLSGRPLKVLPPLAQNPFQLAKMSPQNFLGEIDGSTLAEVERASWVFDRSRGELVYLPRWHRGLDSAELDGAIRFKLTFASGRYALVPASAYSWR
jgi:general secretion pathway protein G